MNSKTSFSYDLCRICFRITNNLNGFSEMLKKSTNVTILNALEVVLQHDFDNEKMNSICSACNSSLEIAFNFVVQFHESTKKLKEADTEVSKKDSTVKTENLDEIYLFNKIVKLEPEEITDNVETIKLIIEPDLSNFRKKFTVQDGITDIKTNFNKTEYVSNKQVEYSEFEPNQLENIFSDSELCLSNSAQLDLSKTTQLEKIQGSAKQSKSASKTKKSGVKATKKKKIVKQNEHSVMKPKRIQKPRPKEKDSDKMFKCTNCQNEYLGRGKFLRHLKVCGELNSTHLCYHCQLALPSQAELSDHIKNLHSDEKGSYFCKQCDSVFASRSLYFSHIRIHKERKFKCNKCDKSFYSQSILNNHLHTHNPTQTVQMCTICGKSFHYKSGLHMHMKAHNNDRRFVCSYCDKKFLVLTHLKDHVKIHTGVKPYDCSYCDKKFTRMGSKRRHEMKHTGIKPIQCKYCGKGWTTKFHYNTHLLTHCGPFSCELCEGTFMEMDILKFHLKYKHKIKEDTEPGEK